MGSVGRCLAIAAFFTLIMSSNCRKERIHVKLIGGSSPNQGTLLVRRAAADAKWGLLCDDGWNERAGQVVCRQLGYTRLKKITRFNAFNTPAIYRIQMDDIECNGKENNIGECKYEKWMRTDCTAKEAAGIICDHRNDSSTTVSTTSGPSTSTKTASPVYAEDRARIMKEYELPSTIKPELKMVDHQDKKEIKELADQPLTNRAETEQIHPNVVIKSITLSGGRNVNEGFVTVRLSDGNVGTICSDDWSYREAIVVCRELGLNYADRATVSDFFRGAAAPKAVYDVNCTGHETYLSECQHQTMDSSKRCSKSSNVAGVICTSVLPDLIPNITALEMSISVQDRYLGHLSCAMEENCLASSAYRLRESRPRDWNHLSRRLLRFSSSIYNNGTADFRPRQHRSSWQWHSCHMHYHSMDTFSHYDIFDANGVRVAEGHKASFCLEDVECSPGVRKKYSCRGLGDQGISVGCADLYKADIDCQWIDITDVSPGDYTFKVNINPDLFVPELSFDNNAVICDLKYTGYSAKLSNCRHSRG